MKILKLKFKNFKSYGNRFVVLDFENDFSNDLSFVYGTNGNGKTTLKDVIEFSIYGKVDGLTLSDLPNRTNKNLEVYIKFESKGKIIEIQRNLQPSFFSLTVDGIIVDIAGKTNQQSYLESELFDMPYIVFKNTIAISASTFKSFLLMTNKDRKIIIDKILNFDVLSEIQDSIKFDIKKVEKEITNIEIENKTNLTNIKSIEDKILNYKNQEDIEYNIKKLEYDSNILKCTEDNNNYNLVLEKLNIKKVESEKKYTNINVKLETIKLNLKSNASKIHTYLSGVCPYCNSNLTDETHKHTLDELNSLITNQKIEYEDLIDDKNKLNKELVKITENIKKIETLYSFNQNKINEYTFALNNINSIKKNNVLIELETFKNELIQKNEYNQTILTSLIDKVNFYKINEDAFSTQGIRRFSLSKIIPLINSNLEELFDTMQINFKTIIDEDFNCVVYSFGEEINIRSLSLGERSKIDFAIIMALLKVLKLNYPSLNILFMDEFFSHIATDVIGELINILKIFGKEYGLNIFFMYHSDGIDNSIFDKKIKIDKNNSFSSISIELLN